MALLALCAVVATAACQRREDIWFAGDFEHAADACGAFNAAQQQGVIVEAQLTAQKAGGPDDGFGGLVLIAHGDADSFIPAELSD